MTTIREEMWKTKGILFNFAITDLKIRYRNSVLGIVWSIIEPLLLLGVLFLVFSTMFRFEIENFPIYLLLGIITWNFFKNGRDHRYEYYRSGELVSSYDFVYYENGKLFILYIIFID